MNRFFLMILLGISLVLPQACSQAQNFKFEKYGAKPTDHSQWTALLAKHVAPNGDVNYKGFIADSVKLNKYLQLLEQGAPNPKTWSKNDQLAYWINAYNAYTVQLIIRNYPLKSIKEIGGKIPFVNSSWDIKFIKIGGTELDLNNIEHGIIRKEFSEPRIHFAVNCASVSCPRLRNEAYEGSKLDAQLTDQAKYFLSNQKKNQLGNGSSIKISKLFKWFKGDFTEKEDLISFINRYSKVKVKENADIDYLEYDWNLNE